MSPTATIGEHPDLDELLALFERPMANRLYSEAVTQVDHALQCAALAEAHGANEALVAAALLHDIGHLLTVGEAEALSRPGVDRCHEAVGAVFLGRWFGAAVTRPVALHVAAKRYLCATDRAYGSTLSPASVHSLELQGGPMDPLQCEAFRTCDGWEAAVALRRWDDLAKVRKPSPQAISSYRPLLERLIVPDS